MAFFIGVDLHKTQFTVHVRTDEMTETLKQIRQYKTDKTGYAEFMRESWQRLFGRCSAITMILIER